MCGRNYVKSAGRVSVSEELARLGAIPTPGSVEATVSGFRAT